MNREQPMIRAGEREYKEYGLFESYFLLLNSCICVVRVVRVGHGDPVFTPKVHFTFLISIVWVHSRLALCYCQYSLRSTAHIYR